jgi:DNA-binding transcriptional MerR regulator
VTGPAAAFALRRIGDVAEATGLTPRTIRYDDEDLERLRLIKRLREVVGLSLADVQTFLETETERRAVSREYQATTDPARQNELLDRAEPILQPDLYPLETHRAR